MVDFQRGERELELEARTSAFVRDKRGNIAVIFALMSIPMLGMIGAAVDFSRAIHLQCLGGPALHRAANHGDPALNTPRTDDALPSARLMTRSHCDEKSAVMN